MKLFSGKELNIKVFLSPMSSISSFPYRMLNRGFGVKFAYLEMINARSLSYNNKKTLDLMYTSPEDRPLGIQLLGREKHFIESALEKLTKYDFDSIDFNAACPKDKVTSKGKGASLLREPEYLKKILTFIVDRSELPVTLKMRVGWKDRKHATDIALMAEDAGVKAIYVHGRTREQGYSGEVDYAPIRKIKKALSIPIIGSGDIFNSLKAKKMFEETGCDAITVARGALGNPWIFKEIEEFLEKGILLERPSIEEILEVIEYHLRSNCDFFGEEKGIKDFRKFFIWYTRGVKGVRKLRNNVLRVNTMKEMIYLIKEFGEHSYANVYY